MRPNLLQRLLAGLLSLMPLAALAEPFGFAAGFNELYRVDMANGQSVRVGVIGFNGISGLAFAENGQLFGVADHTAGSGSGATDFLVRIDPSNGRGTLVGPLGLQGQGANGSLDYGLAVTCDGRIWLSSDTTGDFWEVNRATGQARRVGNLAAPISALAARGNTVFGISVGAQAGLFRITPETASATRIGTLNVGGVIDDAGLDFDANGVLWATLDPEPVAIGRSRLVRIDPTTGQGTLVAAVNADIGMEGLALAPPGGCSAQPGTGTGPNAPTAVPGPGMPALVLLGLMSLLAGAHTLRRRRP